MDFNAAPDISEQLTVFVLTTGEPSFEQCIEHLKKQNCRFRLEIIDHVAPISAALQAMIDRCETKYYVQVDEDMMLLPQAVFELYKAMEFYGPDLAIYGGTLLDVHAKRHIHAIKIYRKFELEQFNYESIDGCEIQQIHDMESSGYYQVRTPLKEGYSFELAEHQRLPFDDTGFAVLKEKQEGRIVPDSIGTLGYHNPYSDSFSFYNRYFALERRKSQKTARLTWYSEIPVQILTRFLENPTEEDFFALQGIMAGALSAKSGDNFQKDYRTARDSSSYDEIVAFFQKMNCPSVSQMHESIFD